MAFQSPTPKYPRIVTPVAPADVEEFNPQLAADPAIPPAPENAVQPVADPASADVAPLSDSDGNDMIETEDAPKPARKAGRPRGSKTVPRTETAGLRPTAKKRKQDDLPDDQKTRTSLYLHPKDHKRLKMLCVEIDMPLTEFASSACLDAMYYSYQCISPACNCEFVVRSSLTDTAPSCPMCGGKKLSRPYLP